MPAEIDRSIPEQRILEQSFRLPPTGAVTGWAALRMHGVGYLDGMDALGELPVPLTVPSGSNIRNGPDAVVHRERLPTHEVTTAYGVPVTIPQRATFDAARRSPDLRSAVVVLDMTLAAGVVDLPSLAGYVNRRSAWPGARRVRQAIRLADARSMSPYETRLRLVWVLDAGLPQPRCNWPVADQHGRFVGRPDLLSTELAVIGEFDGAEHRTRTRHRDDLRRDDAFRAIGLEPFRVVGADLDDTKLVLARINQAITRARASTSPRSWMLQASPRPL